MTPEQIKQWTITTPNGTIYPVTGSEWYNDDETGKHGPFPTRTLALDDYNDKHKNDGTSCLNCGS